MKVSINNNIINNQTDSRMLMTSNSKINNSVDIVQVNNLSSFNNKQQIEYENLSEAILNPNQEIQKQIIDDNNRKKWEEAEERNKQSLEVEKEIMQEALQKQEEERKRLEELEREK